MPLKQKLKKTPKLSGPFLWIEFNCLKVAELLMGDSLLLTIKSQGVLITNLFDLGRIKRLGRPWRHIVDLSKRHLDWESSTLTILLT